MTGDRIKDRENPDGAASSAPGGRDATIEHLEHAIADEREHSATLRKDLDEARFRNEILERSYSKQLEDARHDGEAAQRELAELRARLAELETAHEDALRLLAEARAELDRDPRGRDRLRSALAAGTGTGSDDASSQVDTGSLTINRLMADPAWDNDQPPVAPEESLPETPPTEEESPAQELIAPELVFSADGEDAS